VFLFSLLLFLLFFSGRQSFLTDMNIIKQTQADLQHKIDAITHTLQQLGVLPGESTASAHRPSTTGTGAGGRVRNTSSNSSDAKKGAGRGRSAQLSSATQSSSSSPFSSWFGWLGISSSTASASSSVVASSRAPLTPAPSAPAATQLDIAALTQEYSQLTTELAHWDTKLRGLEDHLLKLDMEDTYIKKLRTKNNKQIREVRSIRFHSAGFCLAV
jgi:hypothetical protein